MVLSLHLHPDSLQSCEQLTTEGPLLWGIVQTLLDQLGKIRVGMVDLSLQQVDVLSTTLYFSSSENIVKIIRIEVCAWEEVSWKYLQTKQYLLLAWQLI